MLTATNFFQGEADDFLEYHNGMMFTTKDRDNDKSSWPNCAKQWKGAWWYNDCHKSHLNGQYLKANATTWAGINWYHFKNDRRSFKKTEMKTRPTHF